MTPLSLFHPAAPAGHSAVFSPCRIWRYALERRWGKGPFCMFVALNPSTADETQNDPTVVRCINYARAWGYGGLLMTNVFGFRATKPPDMAAAPDPVGPDTDVWLATCATRSALVVAAWGTHPLVRARQAAVLSAVGPVHALRLTKDGHPGHPLYLPGDLEPFPWSPA